MKYILFVGSKIGYEALLVLTELNCDVGHVFIEKEHEHEHEKYYENSKKQCELFRIPYNINANKQSIESVIEGLSSYDYVLSFGYRRMISNYVINRAAIAALGTHFSPLPRYRGFAPLNWILINGEKETAVNIFYLNAKVDSGDIVARKTVKIEYEDDINSLYLKCLLVFRKMMKETIPKLENASYETEKQDESSATYTCSRNPEDGLIDWNWNSRQIYNFVRAQTFPFPGAFTFFQGERITIWSCEEYFIPKYESIISGKVIRIIKNKGVVVLCGKSAVLIKEIQLENGKRITSDLLISSIRVTLGRR